jgi:hypothetical protein
MAFDLVVEVKAAAVLGLLRDGQKRVAYAIATSLNATVKTIQAEERASARRRFRIRKDTFVMRQIAVISRGDFADARLGKFYARIHVGQKERLLLPEFEAGGTRKPFGGGRRVAVPRTGGAARPTFGEGVTPGLTVKGLRLIKVRAGQVSRTAKGRSKRERGSVIFRAHQTATGKLQIKGARRTFVLQSTARAPQGGIYQRVGPGRDDIRLIYSFVQDPKLKAMLGWLAIAKHTAALRFRIELQGKIREAFSHSFGKGLSPLLGA